MDWTSPIDLYCERLAPGLDAEPLNALSNAAFFVSAGVGFFALRRGGRTDRPAVLLTILVAAIGAGSLLFHTFASRWAVLADVIPIGVFIYAYLGLALMRFFGFRLIVALASLVAFFGISRIVEASLLPLLGGSASYVPALCAMAATGGALAIQQHENAGRILLATGVFFVSLTLRTMDIPLCPIWPAGTHFLWHILNATTLALLLLALTPPRNPHIAARPSNWRGG